MIIMASLLCNSVAFAQSPQARIKIDTDRTIGEIHPHLFGNFAEHLGRMIYGGIYDEWNVWYRAFNAQKLEEVYNFEDALAMGMFFNSFFRRADVVKMANLAQMVNVIAPITTNKQGLFLQTIYFPLVEFTKQKNNQSLDVFVSAPTYKVGNRAPLKYLDVSTTWNAADKTLFVNVLNRSKDKDLTTRIENQEGQLTNAVNVWELNHPDLKVTHTFGDDKKVRPVTRNITPTISNNGFDYTFPAHSLTILRLKLK
jgi:alpha-N-arabinofuranosidase